MKDLFNSLHPVRGLSPVATPTDNTAQVTQIIDMAGANGLVFLIATGSLPDADATFTVLVEHGSAANLSDAAAVPDSELLGTEALAGFTFADDDETRKIGYVGNKRYVRLTITPASNTGASLLCVIAVKSLSNQPAPNPPV
jgi:hypothetical protein